MRDYSFWLSTFWSLSSGNKLISTTRVFELEWNFLGFQGLKTIPFGCHENRLVFLCHNNNYRSLLYSSQLSLWYGRLLCNDKQCGAENLRFEEVDTLNTVIRFLVILEIGWARFDGGNIKWWLEFGTFCLTESHVGTAYFQKNRECHWIGYVLTRQGKGQSVTRNQTQQLECAIIILLMLHNIRRSITSRTSDQWIGDISP